LPISLEEGMGWEAEWIGGEREGDFAKNFIKCFFFEKLQTKSLET
jgi:hypothetical protein